MSARARRPSGGFVAAILGVVFASSSMAISVPTVAFAAPPAAPSPAAKPVDAEAVAHFRRGVELYEENDFDAALVEFRRAYEIAPNPKVLYNIAQTHYQLQAYAPALETFERYLAESGSSMSAERRKEVDADVAKLRTRVAKLTVTVNVPVADISVDDVVVGKGTAEVTTTVSMGRRRVSASAPGYVGATKSLDVAGGDVTSVALTLVPEKRESKDSVRVATPDGFPLAIPWAAAGVLAAGAVTTGILALSAASDVREREGKFGETRASLDEAQTKAGNLALATDILGGAAIVTTGVALYFTLTRSRTPAPSSRSADVVVTPRGAAIVGTF
ncbi:MAG: tetratricopeptide repeat protein [Polyangiaceae bacterium]